MQFCIGQVSTYSYVCRWQTPRPHRKPGISKADAVDCSECSVQKKTSIYAHDDPDVKGHHQQDELHLLDSAYALLRSCHS